jgi:hypothetical protein
MAIYLSISSTFRRAAPTRTGSVSENIVRNIEEGKTPMQAALEGAGEIGFTMAPLNEHRLGPQLAPASRTIRGNVRFSSCTAGAVQTWHIASIRGDAPSDRFRNEADMRRCHGRIASGAHDPSLPFADQFCCNAQRIAGLFARGGI